MGIEVVSSREILTGLKRLLEIAREGRLPGLVLRCRDAQEALTVLRLPLRPEFLLLDSEIPWRGEVQVLETIRQSRLPTKVVAILPCLDSPRAIEIARLGPAAMISRDLHPSLLIEALGAAFPTTAEGGETRDESGEEAWESSLPLTRREVQIANLAGRGLHDREIASLLGVAEGTVKTHLHEVYRKLNVRSRTELARYFSQRRKS